MLTQDIKICNFDEISEYENKPIWIDELQDEIILLRNSSNDIKIFSSICPHFGGEVCMKNNNLICKWHGWTFSSESGDFLGYINQDKIITSSKFGLKEYSYVLENNASLIKNENCNN